jgi:2'-phosphotransferase
MMTSKAMSFLLRHGAEREGVPIGPDGMMKITDLLDWLNNKDARVTSDDIIEIVMNDKKGRYRLNEDKTKICAVQGHSLGLNVVERKLPVWTKLAPLIHCSYVKHRSGIEHTGLNRMSRQHIHMCDPEIGASWDLLRNNSNMYVIVDTIRARAAGIVFLQAENGVILSNGINGIIPPQYLTCIPVPRNTGCYGFIITSPKAKVLMVMTASGKYGFPKGKRHYREHSLACALRELYEESGLRTSQFTITSSILEEINEKGNCPTVYFTGTVHTPLPKVTCLDKDEGLVTSWMSETEIKSLDDTVFFPRRRHLISGIW